MRRARSDNGQAAAELVAVVVLVAVCALVVAQAAVAGYALWSAGDAARAGARAALVGDDAKRVARKAAPAPFQPRVSVADGRVRVRLSAPALVPGLPALAVSGVAELPAGEEQG